MKTVELMSVLKCPIHDFPVSSICPACSRAATSDRKATAGRAKDKGKLAGRLTKNPRKRGKE